MFCCDAPARSFLCGVVGHTAKSGCSKCSQLGYKLQNSGMIFQTYTSEPRTDVSFSLRRDKSHHQMHYLCRKSALETANIGMVSQFPIDPMHLIDIGITKKLLVHLSSGKSQGHRVDSNAISQRLLSLKKYVPMEFQRRPRSLKDINFWKSTEFRQFLLYTGVVVLYKLVNNDIYNHFVTLHCAIRMLCCPNTYLANIKNAEKLLKNFVENVGILYGRNKISYNVHNLLHITDCVKQFGPIDNFSAYRFENHMQYLKMKIRRPYLVLQQLHNRLSEEQMERGIPKNETTRTKHNFILFQINV